VSSSSSPGYIADKAALSARLKRIEGQVRGIERMVEEERYCIDILTQISASQAALRKVALRLLEQHAAHCVVGSDDPALRAERNRRNDGGRRAPDRCLAANRRPI
jgi:DNA-binding FrmR family transcriptional regulator